MRQGLKLDSEIFAYNLHLKYINTEADQGIYKGRGCPIHLKVAPEVERRRRRGGYMGCRKGDVPLHIKFLYYFIKMVSFFYAFPVIFIDTVLFKKGTLIKRAGVRTQWTPPWIRPWNKLHVLNLCYKLCQNMCFLLYDFNASE